MRLHQLHESGIRDLPDEDVFEGQCEICGKKAVHRGACGPEHLKELALNGDVAAAYIYAIYILEKRWDVAEKLMLNTDPTSNESVVDYMANYANYILQDRWPAAQSVLFRYGYEFKHGTYQPVENSGYHEPYVD